jgi:DNA modification methylase
VVSRRYKGVDKMIDLILGNCLEKKIPKCRLLLTDIPYEEVNRYSNGLRKLDKEKADEKTFEISVFLEHIYESADIFIIFCGNKQYSQIYKFFSEKQKQKKGTVRQLIWAKSNPSPINGEYIYLSGTENAVWFKKSGTGKMNSKCKKNYFIHSTGSSKYHPTEKNHKLLEELILDNTNENDLIVDTCMGSGSTGIIAIKNKRKFVGIELDEIYFNIAKERISSIRDEDI